MNNTMSEIFKVALSLSLSGSLLILMLLALKPLLCKHFSQRWQYYIWLVVIARLLLPFAPEGNLINACFNARQPNAFLPYIVPTNRYETPIPVLNGQTLNSTTAVPHVTSNIYLPDFLNYVWLVWLGIALLLLIRKIAAYQSFVKYVRAGQRMVDDVELLERLAQNISQAGLKRPIDLAVNPLLTTPLLIGLRKPTIVMPTTNISAIDFSYTIQHELAHYKRHDMLYKWLTQLTVCLHWFNPLVWLMQREINRACELACDEAVIHRLTTDERRAYGDTLLRAMEYGGGRQHSPAAINFNEDAKLLKERLRAIMRFKKKTRAITIFSLLLAVLFVIEATVAGAYAIPKAAPLIKPSNEYENSQESNWEEYWNGWNSYWKELDTYWEEWAEYWEELAKWQVQKQQAPQYYAQNDVARMSMIFAELTSTEQNNFLAQAYADNNIAMFAVFLDNMTPDMAAIQAWAAEAYEENNISFLAVLADHLPQEQLAKLLERARADANLNFQLILLKAAGNYDEAAKLEEEMARKQQAEYAQIGITIHDDGRYYYQQQLIHVLLDKRAEDQSCVRLQINPTGSVSVKILRDENGHILSVNQMSATEVMKFLEDELLAEWNAEKDEYSDA